MNYLLHYSRPELASQTALPESHGCFVENKPLDAKTNLLQGNLIRNRVSLGIRCRWGIRNALFYVAKEAGDEKVLGVAMWIPPRPMDRKLSWGEWLWEKQEDWRLWGSQVYMNLWYGRGGLNVKVRDI